MYFNKKSSLEMSIQAIVIVVLAMTLLGLGLGFIKGMFKNITGTTEDVSEQVKQKVLDDLVQGDKKISFPNTELNIDKGGSEVLTIGIKNKGDNPLHYSLSFKTVSIPPAPVTPPLKAELDNSFQYDAKKDYTLGPAASDVRNIRLSLGSTPFVAGSYLVSFKVYELETDASGIVVKDSNGIPKRKKVDGDDSVYATKDFFVVVRG